MTQLEQDLKLGHYPYQIGADELQIDSLMSAQFEQVAKLPSFAGIKQPQIVDHLLGNYYHAKEFFPDELKLTLPYHFKDHAIYQAGFDAAALIIALVKQNPQLAKGYNPARLLSAVTALLKHDVGYGTPLDQHDPTYHSRNPLHVNESIYLFQQTALDFPLPRSLDTKTNRDIYLDQGGMNIFHTHFPFDAEKRLFLSKILQGYEQSEAQQALMTARLAQLGDLGGQAARIDYAIQGLTDLRYEMDYQNNNFGTQLLGDDASLLENCQKFVHGVVINLVGPTAFAIYKTNNNPFYREWLNQGPIRREIGSIHLCLQNYPRELIL